MYQGEQTLLTTRPTRLISFGYYVLSLLFGIGAVALLAGIVPFVPNGAVPGLGLSWDATLASVLAFLAVLVFLIAEIRRASTRYTITDNKIIRVDGILSKRTSMVPYTQLERVDVTQSLLQRVLRIGTVTVDTGDDSMTIEMIPEPAKIQELLSSRMGRRAFIQQRGP
jgi:uncharacterized membrane protein YdbT with pleckstrin-like domain